MAKKKNRPSQKGKRTKSEATPQRSNAAKSMSRRALIQYGAIGGAVLLGGGYFGVRAVEAAICEADLTKIGKGTPSIVQIHDPSCPVCNALQREARKALKAMEGDAPDYFVANISTLEGSNFAADYGVPHVTILLFDGKGEMKQVLQGSRTRAELQPIFEDHMRRYNRG
ncbi:MAG: thioredoxin family protein [Litoreibacter sp.]|nr:thioredoxin family protein [Litoreibacter sp.]MCY4336067.1 thioredoxin family protein [Litoreibacter sp.]